MKNSVSPLPSAWVLSNRFGIVAVAASIGVLFAGSTVLTPLYVMYKSEFGFSQIMLTMVYAVYVVGNLGALLLFGGISDKVGRRPAALISLAVAGASSLAFLLARDVGWLFAGRILSGLAVGIGAGAGTAWIAELVGGDDNAHAAVIATSSNFIGLGLGAFLAGLLADYAPIPLELVFVVLIVSLLIVAALVWLTPETVTRRQSFAEAGINPKVGVPAEIFADFIAPAITGFGAMALVGLYAALVPGILAQQLHITAHMAAGLLFLELAIVVAGVIVGTTWLSSRAAMLWGLGLMIPGVALVTAAQMTGSLAVMIVATAACGVATGLGYRGGLQVVNVIAPPKRRAEVTSAFFICCFLGNALPVIGVGILSTFAGPLVGSAAFAGMVALFSLVALGFGLRQAR